MRVDKRSEEGACTLLPNQGVAGDGGDGSVAEEEEQEQQRQREQEDGSDSARNGWPAFLCLRQISLAFDRPGGIHGTPTLPLADV